jgi:hypothetical protein
MPGHYYVRRLDELPSVPDPEPGDPDWRPVRHYFGIESFGVNAFVATVGDEEIVVEHDEVSGNAQGHQELYYLARGRARFSLDGDELDIDEGTFSSPVPTRRCGAARWRSSRARSCSRSARRPVGRSRRPRGSASGRPACAPPRTSRSIALDTRRPPLTPVSGRVQRNESTVRRYAWPSTRIP